MELIKNGSQIIQTLIDNAKYSGENAVTVTGNYEIDSTIRIPSDFVLTLSNCYLRMADNTFCNMFTNASCGSEKSHTLEGTDRNITIQGVGRAILDGGEYNGLCERNSLKDGRPHISVNNLLLFANVDGFRVTGLHCRNQRWWALNFLFCRNGYIGNIDFLSDYSTIDEEGNRHWGLSRNKEHGYGSVYIKNSDGIDLRSGCHDIIIENITGFTEDDTVALTCLAGKLEQMYDVPELSHDIYNVIVRNVISSAFCSNVRLLNQGGMKLYNILVDGVMDSSKDSPYLDRGGLGVNFGDNHMYGSRHATPDETYNITIRNVTSRAASALRVSGAMQDCLFENIRIFDNENGKCIDDLATVDISGFIR